MGAVTKQLRAHTHHANFFSRKDFAS